MPAAAESDNGHSIAARARIFWVEGDRRTPQRSPASGDGTLGDRQRAHCWSSPFDAQNMIDHMMANMAPIDFRTIYARPERTTRDNRSAGPQSIQMLSENLYLAR